MAVTISIYPSQYNLSKDPILFRGNTNVDQTLHTVKIRIYLSFVSAPTSYTGLGNFVFEETPDASGNFQINFSGLIDEWLLNKFNKPDESAFLISVCANDYAYFIVDWEEYTDGVETDAGVLNDENNGGNVYYAIQAGTPKYFDKLQTFRTWFDSKAPLVPFQTFQPRFRVVDKHMPTFLYFFNTLNPGEIIYGFFKLYYKGTLLFNFNRYTLSLPNRPNRLYMVPTGFTQLDLEGLISGVGYTGAYDRYTVELKRLSDSATITEQVTYYLDPKYYDNKAYIYYQNGISGFDEVRLTGEVITKADHERYNGYLAESISNYVEGAEQVYANREQLMRKVNVQHLGPAAGDRLRELANSPRIFIYENEQMIPIVLTEKTKEYINTGKFMHSTSFEFRYAYKDKVYWPSNALSL